MNPALSFGLNTKAVTLVLIPKSRLFTNRMFGAFALATFVVKQMFRVTFQDSWTLALTSVRIELRGGSTRNGFETSA